MCYCLWLGSGIRPPRTIPLGPKQIVDDARACGYHFSLKEWMLLHLSSKILLRLVGFAELVRRSLTYRLKSK